MGSRVTTKTKVEKAQDRAPLLLQVWEGKTLIGEIKVEEEDWKKSNRGPVDTCYRAAAFSQESQPTGYRIYVNFERPDAGAREKAQSEENEG